jgi:hypothetical protein
MERVHELVTQNVIVLKVRGAQGQDDSAAATFGDALYALGDEAGNSIGLGKIGVIRVEDYRLPL